MNELYLHYIYLIICLIVSCIGSSFIGILDRRYDNCKFLEKKKFKEENKYKYIIGYTLIIIGICLIFYDLIYTINKYTLLNF